MNWYYAEQGNQTGPVDEGQLQELVRMGKIQPDTMVWHEGMADWMPYRELSAAETAASLRLASSDATEQPVSRPQAGGIRGVPASVLEGKTSEAVCTECGKIFPLDQMIRYGDVHVCAQCKPMFMQKLAEGAQINSGGLNYARILTRFAAALLDGLILGAVNFSIGLLAGLTAAQAAGAQPQRVLALQLVLMAIQLAVGITYEVVLIGKYGATLGKMACKIKVVTADGGRVSYLRALGRYFAKMLSAFTCMIGYIIALFDNPQKRALHDHICNTRVVYK